MKRVASLFLPHWSIDRLRRIERRHAPSAEADSRAVFDALGADAAAERAQHCSVPKTAGWRPGARWAQAARAEVEAAIEALPQHQRPPQRELGRVSVAADNPFRKGLTRPAEERVPPPAHLRELSRRTEAAAPAFRAVPGNGPRRSARDGHQGEAGYVAPPSLAQLALMPSVQFPGEGPHPYNHGKSAPTAPTYGQGRFFQTGRTLGSVVARVCGTGIGTGSLPDASAEPPLVTTHKIGARVEIAAANPAARALGLAPGMALTLARAQVPELEVRGADPDGDAAELRAMAMLVARRWAPIVALSDEHGLFIDLTGVAHLHGGEARFARRLIRLLGRYGVTARVAIADTAGAAWALARFHGEGLALIVPAGGQADAIAPLPVAALRLDAPALELLARLGIDTIGQLLAVPRAPLVRRFGRAIVERLDQATGQAPEPLDPVTPAERIMVEQRFAEPIATAEAIEHWLRMLMPRLARALAEAGLGARAVELVAARIDGVPQRLRLGFGRPTRDAPHMLRMALQRIEEVEPGFGIDALALHVRHADPLAPEALVLAEKSPLDLAMLIDTLANRIGLDRLWRVKPVESDVPERSLACAPLLDAPERPGKRRRDDIRQLDLRTPDHPWHPRWPRPVRLLHRPEPLRHVIAELPDQPPRRFTWRGKHHRVVRAEGPERISGEWWRRPGERHAVRDYFRVEVENGQRFWLYRRGDGVGSETGDLQWFLHGRCG